MIGKYCRPGETDEKRGQRPRIAGFDLVRIAGLNGLDAC